MEAGAAIICFVWVLTAFSGGIVTARSAMKILRFHGLAWEDYLMVVSMILAVVYGTSTSLMYGLDFGKQAQYLAPFHSPKFAEYLYISHAIGFMAPLFSRISFCLYMLRVLSTTSVSRKRCIHAFIALQLAVNVPVTIFVFTQCGSFQNLWEHGLLSKSPSCVRHDIIKIFALVAVVFNALTDIFLTILPAVVVWSIKVMTARARLGLVATLGLSFFATIASVIKIYYVYALYTYAPSPHTVQRLIMVMGVEINVVVIAASIPVLAPLFLQKSGGRARKGMYKDPVLPTYDISVESAATKGSGSLQSMSNKTFGTSYSASSTSHKNKNVSITARELSSDTEDDFGHAAHSRQTRITKTMDVTVGMVEVEQDTTLGNESVPQSLRDSVAIEDSGSDLPPSASTPWDELPEIVFLSDHNQ